MLRVSCVGRSILAPDGQWHSLHSFQARVHQWGASASSIGSGRRARLCRWAATASLAGSDTPTNHNLPKSDAVGLFRLLDDKERKIWEDQKQLTRRARELARVVLGSTDNEGSAMSSMNLAAESALADESTFCVVFAGEFNAGKSSTINALLGEKLLKMGTIPTTDCITIISSASTRADPENEDRISASPSEPELRVQSSSLIELHTVSSELALLDDLTIVDTPGTNAVWVDHTETTLNLLPSADLIVFVTSSDRPMSHSEGALLKSIVEKYRKPVMILVNKMDLLEMSGGDHGAEAKKEVTDFVKQHTQQWLVQQQDQDVGSGGVPPLVLPVSARDALAAKQLYRQQYYNEPTSSDDQNGDHGDRRPALEDSSLWRRSNFGAFEKFLQQTLTTDTKIRSKLLSPLGNIERLSHDALEELQIQQNDISNDAATIQMVQAQMEGWKQMLSQEMKTSKIDLCQPLEDEGQRAIRLLRRLSPLRFYQYCLTDAAALQKEWERTKTSYSTKHSTLSDEMKSLGTEVADSIATQGRAQGQSIIEFLGKRPGSRNQSLVGNVLAASRFEETKQNLSDQIGQAISRHVISSQDADLVSNSLLVGLQRQVYVAAACHLGSVVSAAATLAELANLWLGSAGMLTFGTLILSQGRWQAASAFQQEWSGRKDQLAEGLDIIFEKELDRVSRKIRDGIRPYTGSVEAEQERISELTARCEEIITEAHRLRRKINDMKK